VSETALSKSIRSALESIGVWVERIQAGEHKVRGGYLVCASAGTPDLFCPALNLWLEVKRPKDSDVRPSQTLWHARAEREGVAVVVVRSVAEALDAVRERRKAS
jgi:hypothetical protein